MSDYTPESYDTPTLSPEKLAEILAYSKGLCVLKWKNDNESDAHAFFIQNWCDLNNATEEF